MATLTGRPPSSTYKDLLQVSNANAGIDATPRPVEDGEGTQSALQLSTDTVNVAGTFTVNGTEVILTPAAPTDGQTLTFDETAGEWVATDPGGASVGTLAQVLTAGSDATGKPITNVGRITPNVATLTVTAGTIDAPNLDTNSVFTVTLNAASCTLPNPTGGAALQTGTIQVVQDATGSRDITSYGTTWDVGSGITLNTAANAVTLLQWQKTSGSSVILRAVST